MFTNQYICRDTGQPENEKLVGDSIINALYLHEFKYSGLLHYFISSAAFSSLLAFVNYDCPFVHTTKRSLVSMGADFSECYESQEQMRSLRSIFERKIRYWELRPMSEDEGEVVSPADSKVILGGLEESSLFFLKDKFFVFDELIGRPSNQWADKFKGGLFAVFRLTPEKYHYNHTPVAGKVLDFYELEGKYNPCNPTATVRLIDPYSKNKRVVTVIDTDVQGGTGVGLVAMVEVVALMIGRIDQAYSEFYYENPTGIKRGMFLRKGVPKSLFRPGSSTDVLVFQKGRIQFSSDLVANQNRKDVQSRFSQGFGKSLVETDLRVRSTIARRIEKISDHLETNELQQVVYTPYEL